MSMSMFKDKTFTTMQSIFPATVKLDQRLYFEVQVGTNDTNLVLLIERCSATPTTDRNHVSSYDLINERFAFHILFHDQNNSKSISILLLSLSA